MLLRRIYQFLMIYALGLLVLLVLKYAMGLSDYVIPGPALILQTSRSEIGRYAADVADTLSVAVVGQLLSIAFALMVGIAGLRMIKRRVMHVASYMNVPVAVDTQ